ncbi:MAG: glucuronate isomerase [Lachnospiraceae bacterium]
MKAFLDEDFLLSTETAKRLYHEYAKKLPIVDYHCHINPREIYENRRFENITQLWLEADHYKWRLMRSNGVEEDYITGKASDWEKFEQWAKTLELAIGNPLYHWSHLELKRYFGYQGHLCGETAKEVWELCNEKLKGEEFSARGIIERSKVQLLCTTDDPADTLEWHERLKEEESFKVQVLPTWRPDRALSLEKTDYLDYLQKLEKASGEKIASYNDLLEALRIRMDFFAEMGCRISDHGLAYVYYAPAAGQQIEEIFAKRLAGELPSKEEEAQFKTAFLIAMGKEYCRRGWAMQLHFGVKRDNSRRVFSKLGADAGIDCISNYTPSDQLASFLDSLDITRELPKTILYSLNPVDNAAIGTVIGCFQTSSTPGKIQQGSAWWFNDHKAGMQEQMTSLANLGVLGNFIGMLTDSRSFVSYTRHEYFRRILCDLMGGWVEKGEYPADEKSLERIIKGICYNNAVRYFGWEKA